MTAKEKQLQKELTAARTLTHWQLKKINQLKAKIAKLEKRLATVKND